jgi:hypothetical protein
MFVFWSRAGGLEVVRFYVVVVIESDVRLEGYCIGREIGWSAALRLP